MATRFSTALIPDNSTDAHFQAWAQFIEDVFVTSGGWVVTGDTGQTLPSALLHPTNVSLKKGYRIYRMADSLQSTYPVFMRIDFGSASGGTNIPGIWLVIGTGSDGAGNITGVLWNGGGITSPTVSCVTSSTTQVTNSYGSADTGRGCFSMFVQTASMGYYMVFGIERTKTGSGVSTGDGLLLVYGPGTVGANDGGLARARYLRYAGGSQPTEELGWSYVVTNNNPSEVFTPGDVGVGILIHFIGVPTQPGTQWLVCNSSDVSVEGTINMSLYGSTRTYQHLGSTLQPGHALVGSMVIETNARVLMRYD